MSMITIDSILTPQEVAARRDAPRPVQRVVFGVKSLYGLSSHSIQIPLNQTESIDTGQICITIDPDSDPTGNTGMIDYGQGELTVRYGVQAVFPGLYKLITSGKHDISLLNPVRAVATDHCTLAPDLSGWRALGCLDFLPGSIWAGAQGG
jgi:hypothetical protein